MIPFNNFKAQYADLKPEIDAAIQRVLNSSQFVLGEEVAQFEAEFSKYSGAKHGIALNSGTSALHLALIAAGVGLGDEVITTPFTFLATAAAICYVGAKPVFVDIDPESFTLDASLLEASVTKKTKAIIPVHLYGQPADMDAVLSLAKKYRLIVIEDACQAHGSQYKNRKIGSLGDMTCFSFYPTKNLGAVGEGGMVVTSSNDFDKRIRALRDWGQEIKGEFSLKGFNARMEGLQGAVLRVKLKRLEEWNNVRRKNAKIYNEMLKDTDLILPREMPYARHVYHQYTVRVSKNRDVVKKKLFEKGIETGIYYENPIHLTKAYKDLGYKRGDFPVAETASRDILSLPINAQLSEQDIRQVSQALLEVLEKKTAGR